MHRYKASDFSATIDWQDDSTSPATVVPDPIVQGQFDFIGSHTYASTGGFFPSITISRSDGSMAVSNGT